MEKRLTLAETVQQLTKWKQRHALLNVIVTSKLGEFTWRFASINEISSERVELTVGPITLLDIGLRATVERLFEDLTEPDEGTVSLAASSRSTLVLICVDETHCTLYEARMDPLKP